MKVNSTKYMINTKITVISILIGGVLIAGAIFYSGGDENTGISEKTKETATAVTPTEPPLTLADLLSPGSIQPRSQKTFGMPLETFEFPRVALKKPAVGQLAPDFVLSSTEGKEIRLSDFKGKVVVLDFTATWCALTFPEHNNFVKLKEKYGDQITIITIDSYTFDRMEDLKAYQATQNKKWIFTLDNNLDVVKEYGVRVTLDTFVIDKEGIIRYNDVWISSVEELDSAIQTLV